MPFPPLPPAAAGRHRATRRGTSRRSGAFIPWVGLIASTGMALILTVFGVFVFPQYAEMFASFGGELPFLSRTFGSGYGLAWLAPMAVVACWYFGPATWGPRLAGLLGLLTGLLGVVIVIFALYLPYFQMGSLV